MTARYHECSACGDHDRLKGGVPVTRDCLACNGTGSTMTEFRDGRYESELGCPVCLGSGRSKDEQEPESE